MALDPSGWSGSDVLDGTLRRRRRGLSRASQRNDFFRRVLHSRGDSEIQSRFPQNFLTEFDVRPFESHDDRHFDPEAPGRGDDSARDDVAAHDSAENIDEDGADVRVAQNNFEPLADLLFVRAY